jgi:hypothetical protein
MVSHLERLLPTRPSARWHFRNACLKLAKRAARTRIDVPCRNSLRVPKSYDHSCIAAWRWISHQHNRWHCKCYFPFEGEWHFQERSKVEPLDWIRDLGNRKLAALFLFLPS